MQTSTLFRRVAVAFVFFILFFACLPSPASSAPIPSERVNKHDLHVRGAQAPLQLSSIHSGLPVATPAVQDVIRRGFFGKIGNFFKKAGRAVANGVKKAAHAVGRGVKKAVKAVGTGVKKAATWVKKNGAIIAKVGLKAVSAAAGVVGQAAKFVPILKPFAPALKGISSVAGMASNAIKAKLSSGLSKAMGVMDIVRDPLAAVAKKGGALGAVAGIASKFIRRDDGVWMRVYEGPDGALQERELAEGEIDALLRARDAGVKLDIRDMVAEAETRRALEGTGELDHRSPSDFDLEDDLEIRESDDFDEREFEFDPREFLDEEYEVRDLDEDEDELL